MKSSKCKILGLYVMLTAVIFFGFTVINVHAGDPIPGVDVSLEQIPGGVKGKANTGKDGSFHFYNLKSGKYILRILPPPSLFRTEDFNSSRSNLSNRRGPSGVDMTEVTIELLRGSGSKNFQPITVQIGAKKGGEISGHITGRSTRRPHSKKKVLR